MGLDYGALKKASEELAKREKGGNFVYQGELSEETDVRVLPPLPNLNGKYFFEVTVWWINGKSYLSNATFGKPDIIDDYVKEAAASKDAGLRALVEKNLKCQKKSEFHLPVLMLTPVYEGKDIVDFKVEDAKAKVLSVGPMLMKAINKKVTSRKALVDAADGFTDREKGLNLILSKVGAKKDTEYDAELGDFWEAPAKYYEVIPDVYEGAVKRIKSDEYLEGVIRNYLYGEPMPADEETPADAKEEKSERRATTAAAPKRIGKREEATEVDEEKTPPKRTAKAEETTDPPARRAAPSAVATESKAPPRKARNLLSDLDKE